MKKNIALVLCLFSCATIFGVPKKVINNSLKYLHDNNVKYVDFVFSDIRGNLKEVTCPVSYAEPSFNEGQFFDGSSVPGCSNIFESDMLLKPQLDTLSFLPWSQNEVKTARVMCDIYESENLPYEASPRNILKRVLAEAQSMGYDFFVGPELEFFVLKNSYMVTPFDADCYFASDSDSTSQNEKRKLLNALIGQNIDVEKLHHEVAPGQLEMSLHYGNAVALADQILLTKHTIKTFAKSKGLTATFMPKPLFGQNGSAMHVHFSLFDRRKKQNAFYDKKNKYFLSATAQKFIAGVLHHLPEITALLNPTVNSYKRLVPGYEAPVYLCWAGKNRSAVIRIPQVNGAHPGAIRAELRSPDPMTNPYLAFAAILKAGIAGIKNNYKLPAETPENLYKLTAAQRKERGIASLPTSLQEALTNLKTSQFALDLLGKRFLDEFVSLKTKELYAFNTAVTNWETENYL